MAAVTNETWLAVRAGIGDGFGTGSPLDPYAANTPESFGNIMNAVSENSTVRLGPGVFQTRGGVATGTQGYLRANFGWQSPAKESAGIVVLIRVSNKPAFTLGLFVVMAPQYGFRIVPSGLGGAESNTPM